MTRVHLVTCAFAIAAVTVVTSESASGPLARELVQLMTQAKLDAVAAIDPVDSGRFVAALVAPGQLLVVSARYPAQQLLADQLARKAYRDVYGALHGSSIADTRFFVQDIGADGLHNGGESVDVVYEKVNEQTIFDSHPEKHKIDKRVYAERFERADGEYSTLLKLLLTQLRDGGQIAQTPGHNLGPRTSADGVR